jgi:HSP20 family molecular chaperone IbpA
VTKREHKIDLIEETSRLVLKAELPGVPSDAIELSYDAQKNTIYQTKIVLPLEKLQQNN